ncbi:MAG: hypothetical protein KGL34_10110 [Gammaproteobacteria bacterium]|nr:hypothetical protein [Gammaproteobacteria bacterium]
MKDRRIDIDDETAALVDRGLHTLAPRPAPAALEARVMAELQRRAALPWWRRPVAAWPPAPRFALIAASLAAVPFAWRAGAWTAGGLATIAQRAGAPLGLLRDILHSTIVAQSAMRLFDGGLPPPWVLALVVIATTLYAALLGLGAFAYRSLYLNP